MLYADATYRPHIYYENGEWWVDYYVGDALTRRGYTDFQHCCRWAERTWRFFYKHMQESKNVVVDRQS